VNGEFALIVVHIDKGNGLKGFDRVYFGDSECDRDGICIVLSILWTWAIASDSSSFRRPHAL
jgi:hypothetical protein